jgi:hypothetical protein
MRELVLMVKMPLKALALTMLSIGALSCDGERVTSTPASDKGLALETSISASVVEPGQTVTFRYELRNVSGVTLTATFSGCTVIPYIATPAGTIVYSAGGCVDALYEVTLAPGQAISKTLDLRVGMLDVSRTGTVTLLPGRYRAYAEAQGAMGDSHQPFKLRSPNLTFLVRED